MSVATNVLMLLMMAVSFIGTIAEKDENQRKDMRNLFVFVSALFVVFKVI